MEPAGARHPPERSGPGLGLAVLGGLVCVAAGGAALAGSAILRYWGLAEGGNPWGDALGAVVEAGAWFGVGCLVAAGTRLFMRG